MRQIHRTGSLPALVLAVALLCGCQGPAVDRGDVGPAVDPAAASSGSPSPGAGQTGVRSIVVLGDSLTAGGKLIRGPEVRGEFSWLHGAVGPPLEMRGGWATGGATTADMRAAAVRMDADVLVLMGGTNDMLRGRPWEEIRADLVAAAEVVGIGDVMLCAVPPNDELPGATVGLNEQLRVLAQERGWRFVDPWSEVNWDGAYRPGASLDGVHPTQRVAAEAGLVIREAALGGAPASVHQPG